MWVMMLISFSITAYIDTRGFKRLREKGSMPLYLTLMAISCAIGTASRYVKNMPTPAEPIKNIVLSLIGK